MIFILMQVKKVYCGIIYQIITLRRKRNGFKRKTREELLCEIHNLKKHAIIYIMHPVIWMTYLLLIGN